MINPLKDVVAVDYGDAPNDHLSTERTMEPIREIVREAMEVKNSRGNNVIPFVIGGDHSISYPSIAAAADVYGKGNVGVVHFDAHYDAGDNQFGHMITHGTPVRRLIEGGYVPGKNFIQVGLRGWVPEEGDMTWMREQGIRSHYMAEVERDGFNKVMERAIAEALDGPEYLFISVDMDSLDPAYAPGTGTPEPGGLTPREAFKILRRLCAESNVIGFELVELAPMLDPTYVSAMNANRLIRECMTGVAMRKQGLTDPHYLSPLTREHGN